MPIAESDFLKPTPLLRKLQILRLISQDPKRSQNQLAKDLEFSVSAVNRIVRELQRDGALIWQAQGWSLTKKGNRLMLELTAAYNSELESLLSLRQSPEPQPAEPIRIGTLRSLGTVVPLVARKLNLFDAVGLHVDIQLYDYAIEMLEDLLAGRLTFAYGGMATFLESKRKSLQLEILAACNSGGHALVAKRTLGIAGIEDLTGTTLLVPPESTMTYRLFSSFLQSRYPSLIERMHLESSVSPANMALALESNERYAAMVSWEPWVSFAETRFNDLQVIVDFVQEWQDAVGRPYSTTVLVSLAKTVVEKHDLVQTILTIHESAINFLNERPQQSNEIVSDVLSMPYDVIERARTRVSFHSDLKW
jgi:NitT/TauT family transport system substrate-binding protein